MRDKKRIRKILKLLEKRWKKNPEWRFFQLLHVLNMDIYACKIYDKDLFYFEDDKFLEYLKNIIDKEIENGR